MFYNINFKCIIIINVLTSLADIIGLVQLLCLLLIRNNIPVAIALILWTCSNKEIVARQKDPLAAARRTIKSIVRFLLLFFLVQSLHRG